MKEDSSQHTPAKTSGEPKPRPPRLAGRGAPAGKSSVDADPAMAQAKGTQALVWDDFFAETEQVAFCTAHVVPGIDFSNDPLLAGRHHSYVDTQITRLGGAKFHELPINASLAPVSNNQRSIAGRGCGRRGVSRFG